jgi:glycosyltransferase involved in cell wall biosynthesis
MMRFPDSIHATSPTIRVLYISYDGLLEPLGQSQILPYLERVSTPKIQFFLLTYEKKRDASTQNGDAELRERLRQSGIVWVRLRYHKSPTIPATLYDILIGFTVAVAIVRRHKVQIVHARSYVPALIAFALKWLFGVGFLFDMRGFWADERVEGGIWRAGSGLYRVAKAFERTYLRWADAVVSLTHAAEQEIGRFGYLQGRCPPIAVIPTCVELSRFRCAEPGGESARGTDKSDRFILVYSGSLGTWYLLSEMLEFFLALKRRIPDASFLVLTQGSANAVETAARKYGIDETDLSVRSVPFQQMPEWIATGKAGIFFAQPSWANKARCPTKLAEFLAVGIPVVTSRGIGDVETIVREERVGVIVEQFTDAAYERGLAALVELLREDGLPRRCRQVAARYFSLEIGASRYQEAYRTVASKMALP